MGEIEHRLLQDALLSEQEGDQQPSHPPIAIQKGMDGFELGMGQTDANQGRQIVLGMEKLLQSAQRLRQLLRGWRHKRGRGQAAAAGADPVLATAQLTRSQPAATHALQQFGVDLGDQPHRHRQRGQPLEAMVHRLHIVHHFIHIARQALGAEEVGLRRQQILQGALGALDLAREHRLLAHIHEHKQIGIRQGFHRPIQPAQGPIGLGEQHLQLAAQLQRRIGWQRRRMEGPVARGLAAIGAGTIGAGLQHGVGSLSHGQI